MAIVFNNKKFFNFNSSTSLVSKKSLEISQIEGNLKIEGSLYKKGEVIGKGSFKKATVLDDGTGREKYVFSEIKNNTLSQGEKDDLKKDFEKEHRCFTLLNKVVGFIKKGAFFGLVSKYYNLGSLQTYLNDNKSFIPFVCKKEIVTSCLTELKNMHSKNIIHRDIKPDNIVIKLSKNTNKFKVMIIDYSFAVIGDERQSVTTCLGTLPYAAPWYIKVCQGSQTDIINSTNEKQDIWAMGCTLYDLIKGERVPWQEEIKNPSQAYEVLTSLNQSQINKALPDWQEKGTWDHLLWMMLQTDPSQQKPLDEIVEASKNLKIPGNYTLSSSPPLNSNESCIEIMKVMRYNFTLKNHPRKFTLKGDPSTDKAFLQEEIGRERQRRAILA